MNVKSFLPKENHDLPDNYGIKIFYISGKMEEFELAEHSLNKDTGMLEFWTKDDVCNWVIISNIQRIEFDKRFSKLVAIKNKIDGAKGANA